MEQKRNEKSVLSVENLKEDEMLDVEIGTNKPVISAKQVFVQNVEVRSVSKDDKELGFKAVFLCKHPDVGDRLIEISGAKYIKNDKLVTGGLWLNLDAEKKISFNSAVGIFLRFFGLSNLKNCKNRTFDTVIDEKGYLLIKAY